MSDKLTYAIGTAEYSALKNREVLPRKGDFIRAPYGFECGIVDKILLAKDGSVLGFSVITGSGNKTFIGDDYIFVAPVEWEME